MGDKADAKAKTDIINKATISEGLSWRRILEKRLQELCSLRDTNSAEVKTFFRETANPVERTPTYDVKKLDKLIARIHRELRLLDTAVKKANAETRIEYSIDDAVLGELS